jgi:hypothetical protein
MENICVLSLLWDAELIGRDMNFYLGIMPAVSKRDANEKTGIPVTYR